MIVRVALDRSPQNGRMVYILETLLSAIGVPYELSADSHQPSAQDTLTLTLSQGKTGGRGGREEGESRDSEAGGQNGPSSVVIDRPSLEELFATVTRAEEYGATAGDKYERFLFAHTAMRPPETAVRPVVSEYALQLLDSIKESAAKAGLPMVQKQPWPGGKRMAACLTHDVDAVRRGKLPRGVAVKDVTSAISAAARGRVGQAAERVAAIARTASRPNPYWTFGRIAEMEKEHGFRSTYFVMAGHLHPQDAFYDLTEPRMARLILGLANSGCEIGLHGSFASHTTVESMRCQKSRLETALGAKVTGHRNHVLRFRVPDSWRTYQAAGFSYDATLGYADHEGYRGGHAFPFHPYDITEEKPLTLLEIPLAVMDATLHKYRGLRGPDAQRAMTTVLGETVAVGGLATLLWHNDTFYEPEYPGCGLLYERAMEWLSDHDAWVATCGEVDRWWRARDAARISLLPGGKRGWSIDAGERIEGLTLRVSLPVTESYLRVSGCATVEMRRDRSDYILEMGSLAAGSRVEIQC